MLKWMFAVSLALVAAGCETTKATGFVTPKERVTECKQLCESVGMRMTALVVIMSSAGCVCELAEKAPGATTSAGAGTASGGAIIAAAAAAQAASQQQQQQQQVQRQTGMYH